MQVHFFFLRRIRAARTSHCSRRIGSACFMDTRSSLKVVSRLNPLASSGFIFTGESSRPRAYRYNCCPAFSPRSAWILGFFSWARSPMVRIPASLSFFSEDFPRKRRSLTGSGHIFTGISSGNRVCTLSGFSKSEAIFASSLLTEMPIFTVNPSSVRILSFSSWAVTIGSG